MEIDQVKSPPPIFVGGLLQFVAFHTKLIDLVGINNFFVKSTFKT